MNHVHFKIVVLELQSKGTQCCSYRNKVAGVLIYVKYGIKVSSWLKAQIMRLFVSIIDASCDLPLILRDYTLITLFTFHFGKMQKQLGTQSKSYKDRRTGTIGRRMNAKSFAWGRNVNSTVASQMCVSSCDDKCKSNWVPNQNHTRIDERAQ